ncbi:MAG: acyl-ACP--UDP-N-acetylglucosamine O-acyltransferase [Gammaproteobacteria bacterium]|nr:acyl-ACP--UDP-N-acetylglucosamine O-acyltransferase [Gammaproteobacteria bacterium]
MIHPTAVIHPSAVIANHVEIGPWTVIGANVEIGDNTWIGPHVVIHGPAKIGENNKIYQFASVAEDPQDKGYVDEQTYLTLGDNNIVREFCTLHRGTPTGRGTTEIGHDNMFMAYSHVAHDCKIGDHTIFTNNASLAGHVVVGDYAIIGAFSAVHQFCHIGAHSFIARATMVPKDVLPYVLISGSGQDASTFGINSRGLSRRGFSTETVRQLKQAYKIIFRQGNTVEQALEELYEMVGSCPEIEPLITGLKNADRGIIR